MSATTGRGSEGRRSKGLIDGVSTQILAATALAFFAMLAMTAIEGRGRSGLPDILVDVKLGGKMKINTANGPMLVTVGNHMKCPQCTSLSGRGVQSLAACPCSVPVGGMKDGVYYTGVITVKRTDNEDANDDDGDEQAVTSEGDADDNSGCNTKPLHLRVTAQGNFLDGLPVFAGDEKTEAMLQQLLKYFGPDPQNGLILDGTLTCKQEWDMMHPDYLIPKPGYPSDIAVKIPYGSTLRPLKNKLDPFKTEIPEVLRQKYGGTKLSRRLRKGLLKAEESPLFQRDAARFRSRGRSAGSEADGSSSDSLISDENRKQSMKSMLQNLAEKVDKISSKTQKMDSTLSSVTSVLGYSSQ